MKKRLKCIQTQQTRTRTSQHNPTPIYSQRTIQDTQEPAAQYPEGEQGTVRVQVRPKRV